MLFVRFLLSVRSNFRRTPMPSAVTAAAAAAARRCGPGGDSEDSEDEDEVEADVKCAPPLARASLLGGIKQNARRGRAGREHGK